MPAILALRFVQGVASAAVQAAGPAIIADAVPPSAAESLWHHHRLDLRRPDARADLRRLPRRPVGLARGVPRGGALVLVLLAPIHFMLTASWRRPPRGAVHLPSTLLAVAAMLALVGGAATLREGAIGYAAMALGLALLAAFVFWQRRVAQPLLNVELLMKNIVLRSALLVQWLLYCNAFGTVFLLSLYMQSVLGHSANTSGESSASARSSWPRSRRWPASSATATGHLIASCGVALALVAALMAIGSETTRTSSTSAWVLAVQGLASRSSPRPT